MLHGPDGNDDHARPAVFQNPYIPMPPASADGAEYPLAAAFVPAHSSNFTSGGIVSYDYVVVHTMQGYYNGSIAWFQDPVANVSAHYCMRAEDGEVTQMVLNADRAWHVGNNNSQAIGIEHEGFIDDPAWYTWETYESSAQLARWLCDTYDIPIDRSHVVGHVELPGQTHTDPGTHWDWDRYMALIEDVVPQGRIEGVVVDASAACTITANVDTWLKATPQQQSELDSGETCSIPAGTEITYVWAEDTLLSHRRLTMVGGGPCEGLGELEFSGFVFEGHFDGLCDPADQVLTDVQVQLDSGAVADVDAAGYFAFDGVEPGTRTLDVTEFDGFEDALASVGLEVYPGARVVIPLDPDGSGNPGGGDSETGGDSSDDSSSSSSDSGGGSGDDESGTEGPGGDPEESDTTAGGALPDYNDPGEGACACRSTQDARLRFLPLLLIFVAGLRRRAAARRHHCRS